jgi:hypothetical protein
LHNRKAESVGRSGRDVPESGLLIGADEGILRYLMRLVAPA